MARISSSWIRSDGSMYAMPASSNRRVKIRLTRVPTLLRIRAGWARRRPRAAEDQRRVRAPPPELVDHTLHEGDQPYVAARQPRENGGEERMGGVAQGDDADRASRRGDVTDRFAQSCFERADDRHVFPRDSGRGPCVREHCPRAIRNRTGLQEKDLSTLSKNRARPGEALCPGERSHASEEHERWKGRAGGPECKELDREILVAHFLALKPPRRSTCREPPNVSLDGFNRGTALDEIETLADGYRMRNGHQPQMAPCCSLTIRRRISPMTTPRRSRYSVKRISARS